MHLGSAWYPEQWPESRWPRDLELMRETGFTVARITEFAWSRMEPADGVFALDWVQRVVDLAARHGIAIVLGTPSAAPPAWLTHAHPEVLPQHEHGHVQGHGARCHYRAGSPVYQRYSNRIAGEMARRFGRHPNVIGWQIDNEYWRMSRDPETTAQFQGWLRRRYGTLDALNAAWSGAYWSQDYFAWDQIESPNPGANPGLMLAWQQFCTQLYVEFQRGQIGAIRAHAETRQWICHNFHPNDDFDREAIGAGLDLVAWDAYIHRTPRFMPGENAHDCDRIRGLKRKNIWIMETQPGTVNWSRLNLHQPRGQMRSMAWQMVGHGADAVLYWQWRSAPGGQEQYHGCVLAQDGEPRPRQAEIARIGAEFATTSALIDGSTCRNQVAILDRWRDRWVLRHQPHHHAFTCVEHSQSYYAPLQRAGVTVDVLDQHLDLSPYRLVVAPHLHLGDAKTVAALRAFVANGGHLVLGMRSFFKDDENRLAPERQPGPLADLLGGRVRDHYTVETTLAVAGELGKGSARAFAEDLETTSPDTRAWLHYDQAASAESGWLAGRPAVLHRRVGAGSITYVGAWLDDALADRLIGRVLALAQVEGHLRVPAGVEVCARWQGDRRILIVVNHADAAQTVPLPHPQRDHLGDRTVTERLDLPAYGVAVLTPA